MFPSKLLRSVLLVSACVLALSPALVMAKKDVTVDPGTAANPTRADSVGGINPVPTASIEFGCAGGGKIKISTGSNSGSCSSSLGGGATCALDGTQLVKATCSGGCTLVTSGATCQVIN